MPPAAPDDSTTRRDRCMDAACRRRSNARKGTCSTEASRVRHIMKFHSIHNYHCPMPGCTMKNPDVFDIGIHLKFMHPNAQSAHRKIHKGDVNRSKKMASNKIDKYFPTNSFDRKEKTEESNEENEGEEVAQPQVRHRNSEQPRSSSARMPVPPLRENREEPTEMEPSEDSEPELYIVDPPEVSGHSHSSSSCPTPGPATPQVSLPSSGSPASAPLSRGTPPMPSPSPTEAANEAEDDDIIVERHIIRSGPNPRLAVQNYVERFGIPKAKVIHWRPPSID
uniref:C2H2-type domain-containing protein n=1 Tax=Steinernema glaseri TaxID=37863 RepID=A0A1I7ZGN6_9BILA